MVKMSYVGTKSAREIMDQTLKIMYPHEFDDEKAPAMETVDEKAKAPAVETVDEKAKAPAVETVDEKAKAPAVAS